MKIVLVGYMGSGKSTVGKRLAKDLGFNFFDLDSYMEASQKMKIPEIFKEKGEIYFRKIEKDCVREVLSLKEDLILSTGGGTPCYGGNIDVMLALAEHVFFLKVSIPELVKRLSKEKEDRPLIRHIDEESLPEFIGRHLFERNNFYSRATKTIDCDNKEPRTIVEEVKGFLV